MRKVLGKVNRKKVWIPILSLVLVMAATIIYQSNKSLPEGLSFEGELYSAEDVQFLYDLTFEKENGKRESEQQIFKHILKAIDEAEDFIVMDMFLFNGFNDGDKEYPDISGKITDKLIEKSLTARIWILPLLQIGLTVPMDHMKSRNSGNSKRMA